MTEANRRKKNPEQVRKALLDSVIATALECGGLEKISLQSVATKAGVTKGGLFHHFPNKKALIESAIEHLFELLECEIDALMKGDTDYGCFTRAYIKSSFEDAQNKAEPLSMLLPVFLDTMISGRYYGWLAARVERHKSTDDYPWLEIIRYAADGLWFSEKAGTAPNSAAMWDKLLAATHSKQA